MTHDPHHLTGAYAAGALNDAERAEVEAHLLECADCAREVDDLREALAELSVLTEAEPPPELRAAVLGSISQTRPLPPAEEARTTSVETADIAPVTPLASRRRALTWITSAAAAVAVLVAGLVWQPWSSEPSTTTAQTVLEAADARTWSAPVGTGKATVAHSATVGQLALVLDGMAAPPAQHGYQAWYQHRDGSMTSAGVVRMDSTGHAAVLLTGNATDAVGVGLTVEPEAGSPQPTTDPLVLVPMA